MNYDLNYGDKKSNRYNFIKQLVQPQLGSGLNQYTQSAFGTRATSPSKSLTCTGQRPVNPVVCIFLPSDPDELVYQLKLLCFEKVGGNDNSQLNEQIIAIVDKLLEYECITTNQHQNIISACEAPSVIN